MAVEVTMPKLSDTMDEGKVLRWLKAVGDRVRAGDILAEVETDKAEMELEAYDDGVLSEIRVGEGETVPVGAVLAMLETGAAAAKPAAAPGASRAAAPPPRAPTPPPRAPAPPPPPARAEPATRVAPPSGEERQKASPLARKIASERGVDLGRIAGSGPGGRIVERDVAAALATMTAVPAVAAPARPVPAPAPAPARPATRTGRVELSRMRRATAKRMADAKREVPHFYVSADIAMDEAVAMKAALAGQGEPWSGLTYTHLLLKACGIALMRVPEVNAALDGDAIVLHDVAHVGLATAVDDGLIVPVIHGCDTKPLVDLVRDARAAVERARAGQFAPDDLVGATFTLSNLGMFPVSEFAAIVNPPQVALLAAGTVRDAAVVRGGQVVPGHRMTVTLSCDHRAIDGALAGRFLRELASLLERPVILLV